MAVISQAIETVIAIIIFVVLALLFLNMYGSTECDKLSNSTAIEITDAINKVALESGVSPWTQNSVPPTDNTNNYVSVQIKLCHKNIFQGLEAQFIGQVPEYIITYEQFPQRSFAWSESQPFSGGASGSLLNYFIMKFATKIITGSIIKTVTKYGSMLVRWTITKIGGAIKTVLTLDTSLISSKFTGWLDDLRQYEVVQNFLNRIGAYNYEEPIDQTLDDRYNIRYYGDDPSRIMATEGLKLKGEGYSDIDALTRIDALQSDWDKAMIYGETAPVFRIKDDGTIVYLVKDDPQSIQFMHQWITNHGDAAEEVAKHFEFPSKFENIEEFKNWLPSRYSIQQWYKGTRLSIFVSGLKYAYNTVKDNFNEWFNYEDGMSQRQLLPEEIAAQKNYAFEHVPELREEFVKNFDELQGILENNVPGKTFSSADDITDLDVIKVIANYGKGAASYDLVNLAPHTLQISDITDLASKHFGEDISSKLQAIADVTHEGVDATGLLDAFQYSYLVNWESMTYAERQAIENEVLENYKIDVDPLLKDQLFQESFNDARAQLLKELPFKRDDLIAKGILEVDSITGATSINPAKINYLVEKSKEIQSNMLYDSIKIKNKFLEDEVPQLLKPVVTDQSLSSVKKVTSYTWGRFKRGIFLDLNRIGQGPIAPYNIVPSSYNMNQALQKSSEGCDAHAICKIQRGVATGSTETSTSYLLDKKVPDSIDVKLWRPNPDFFSRYPIGINTGLFRFLGPTENPRFHVIGPCFATAKVWKNGNTVYVDVEKGKKCDVSGCNQTGTGPYKIPLLGDIPGLNQIFGGAWIENADTPNYCYADEDFLWGQNNEPYEVGYYGGYTTCVLATAAVTKDVKSSLKICAYAAIGTLEYNTYLATQAYADVPSWRRQETGWGYWNYQKATDICDTLEMLSNFGSFKNVQTATGTQKIGSTIGKISKTTGIGLSDVCYFTQVMGDQALSWPVKTPFGEVIKKAAILDEKCMQDTAPNCVWINKCTKNEDCPLDSNGNHKTCDINTGKCL